MTYICNDCETKYEDNIKTEFFTPCPKCHSFNCSIDKKEPTNMYIL